MKSGFNLVTLVASLLVWFCMANPMGSLAAESASADSAEALRLLQSAATRSAIDDNEGAEKSCRELLDTPALLKHVDAIQVRLLLASSLRKQKRNHEAYALLVETLTEQRKRLGDDHADIQDTLQAFGDLVINLTWARAVKTDLPKEDYAEATTIAKEASSLAIPHGKWSLALLQLRQGEENCLESIAQSLLDERDTWLGQFSILSMALAQNGKHQLARDAYAIVCDRGAKQPSLWEPIQIVHDQAGAMLEQNTKRTLEEMSREKLFSAYSRLIDAYPGVARLHAWRANHLQCLNRFGEAEFDLHKATEMSPANWRFGEALATVRILMAEGEEQTKVCKDLMNACFVTKQYGTLSGGGAGMDVILLCSVAKDANLDRVKLLGDAEDILKTTPSRPFLELGRGMALYRVGRYEDSLDAFPGAEVTGTSGKDRGLPMFFRAMAFHQLGEKRAAKAQLKDAEKYFDSLFAGESIIRMRYQDEGTHYCLLSLALKEARTLLESDGN